MIWKEIFLTKFSFPVCLRARGECCWACSARNERYHATDPLPWIKSAFVAGFAHRTRNGNTVVQNFAVVQGVQIMDPEVAAIWPAFDQKDVEFFPCRSDSFERSEAGQVPTAKPCMNQVIGAEVELHTLPVLDGYLDRELLEVLRLAMFLIEGRPLWLADEVTLPGDLRTGAAAGHDVVRQATLRQGVGEGDEEGFFFDLDDRRFFALQRGLVFLWGEEKPVGRDARDDGDEANDDNALHFFGPFDHGGG